MVQAFCRGTCRETRAFRDKRGLPTALRFRLSDCSNLQDSSEPHGPCPAATVASPAQPRTTRSIVRLPHPTVLLFDALTTIIAIAPGIQWYRCQPDDRKNA